MSKFRCWSALCFLINIYFISGTEEPNNPLKRPWLDHNANQEDSREQPGNFLDEPRRSSLDPNHEPHKSPEHPQNTGPTCNSQQNSSLMRQHRSSSNHTYITYEILEARLLETEKKWDELRNDPGAPKTLQQSKWQELCSYMLHKILDPGKNPRAIECKPSPYILGITSRKRRIKFLELKNNTKEINLASDLLMCFCLYYSGDDNKWLQERFAIKPYKYKRYFLLKRFEDNPNRYFRVSILETYKQVHGAASNIPASQ